MALDPQLRSLLGDERRLEKVALRDGTSGEKNRPTTGGFGSALSN